MPDDTPNVDQPEPAEPTPGRSGAPEDAAGERERSHRTPPEEGLAEDASTTRHAQPGEDSAGWKAASEAGKDDDSSDSHP